MSTVTIDRGAMRALREELGIELPGDVVQAVGDVYCLECGGPLIRVHGGAWIRAFTQYLWVHARPADYARAPHRAMVSVELL